MADYQAKCKQEEEEEEYRKSEKKIFLDDPSIQESCIITKCHDGGEPGYTYYYNSPEC